MRLRYTKKAAAELEDGLDYIAARSPQGEHSVGERIRRMIELIQHHPLSGRLTTTGRLRRLSVTPYPYLIFYRVTDDAIVIHGVRHTARRPSSMPR